MVTRDSIVVDQQTETKVSLIKISTRGSSLALAQAYETLKNNQFCTVPVKRVDLNSHAKWLLNSSHIDQLSLIFDEIDLSYFDLVGDLKLVLPNGDKLPAKQEALKEAVVEIFNCRKGQGFSQLLLAGILLDTENLTNWCFGLPWRGYISHELGTNWNLYALVFGEFVLNDAMAISLYRTMSLVKSHASSGQNFSHGLDIDSSEGLSANCIEEVGCSIGHPAEIILSRVEELKHITTLVAELNENPVQSTWDQPSKLLTLI
ncbi:hypothetical protein F0562_005698 [Nyssa sinensis]|uniref:Uncharacterized protein n=1 Tax=Nyssa sinensis TaxID=561372 RepID=A0A5J5AML1_9ASTE|nr:hypothetical protein F0562_005698 [Nyssa sinensis]